ncbi:hypothetical protein [Rhodococcus sp. HNM0569]|uniref:hypothetical protein n=1 Tax=Rhodococcus sp. HNM0569 TaxID=2716340 RepID=UPI00146B1620|nr:hypothetical protein [Rhodococcus sp. HNM0569]NLU84371.1 hypothetical protein [Rhodococcus sp. HNM0569]
MAGAISYFDRDDAGTAKYFVMTAAVFGVIAAFPLVFRRSASGGSSPPQKACRAGELVPVGEPR